MLLPFGACIAVELILFAFANDSSRDSGISAILQKLKTLEEEVSTLKQRLKSCQNGHNEFSKSNTEFRERRFVLQGQGSQIAFHAQLTHNIENLGIHQAILFDNVLLNEGNGYSIYEGEFIAPVSGLYVFAWTISSGDRTCMKYDVVKNSVVLTYHISDAANHIDWAVSSGTVVTRMYTGDRVWIRVSDFLTCSHTVYGTGYGTSLFAGFLLN
ncbi:complement C1q-like protein 4 [Crassostrea angulata]|uniref:complement C1q-like protein 4 n=1 Tax=Magallana angulata TaxID=2784310 RepID=UPI00148A2CE2|nr:complement C1q-like protein 4 [Crassostrea gigas]XP_052706001.1 complement C1q-like protein 4 [Crassostrea angulata]